MAATLRDFRNWAIHLCQKVEDSDGGTPNVWLVPAKWHFKKYVNNRRSLPDKIKGRSDDPTPQRSLNEIFEKSTSSINGNSRHDAVGI